MYLTAAGWHTEIALPIHAIHGPLRALTPDFPGSQYLLFGWGERNYYMARAPTFDDAMRALFPGPAVLLVTPLYRPPRESRAGAQVFEVGLSTAGLNRLSNHIWAALEKSGDGTPRRLAAGPDPGSAFYVATGTYSATYTCNKWTAEGMRVGGIPVTPAGVVFASQVTDQLRSAAARTAGQELPGQNEPRALHRALRQSARAIWRSGEQESSQTGLRGVAQLNGFGAGASRIRPCAIAAPGDFEDGLAVGCRAGRALSE